jgi:hypothetical protein
MIFVVQPPSTKRAAVLGMIARRAMRYIDGHRTGLVGGGREKGFSKGLGFTMHRTAICECSPVWISLSTGMGMQEIDSGFITVLLPCWLYIGVVRQFPSTVSAHRLCQMLTKYKLQRLSGLLEACRCGIVAVVVSCIPNVSVCWRRRRCVTSGGHVRRQVREVGDVGQTPFYSV